MGCDIHLFVEKREGATAPWRPVRVEMLCWCVGYPGLYGEGCEYPKCHACGNTRVRGGWHDRNYDLFAMLANVRNGTWGAKLAYICPPRGLPRDLSTELAAIAAGEDRDNDDVYELREQLYGAGWFGDHSHSYLSLAELQRFNWKAVNQKRGLVELSNYGAVLETGRPKEYCAAVGGSRTYVLSGYAMEALYRCCSWTKKGRAKMIVLTDAAREALQREGVDCTVFDAPDFNESFYTTVHWEQPYSELAGNFYTAFMPKLAALGAPDDVRIVFGFDS